MFACVAGGVLGRVGRDVAEVVARALDVEGRVGDAAEVQRRFSTQGAAWTSWRSRCWPSENGVEKKSLRSWSSRSSEL